MCTLAGLIGAGETAEQAAIRELEEETGYKAEKIEESSPVTVADPGGPCCSPTNRPFIHISCVGMTTANMKLVVVSVPMDDKLETPASRPDEGEYIEKRVVSLDRLDAVLKGTRYPGPISEAESLCRVR